MIIGDGNIFPALTGLPSGFGIVTLFSVLAITFGIHRWVVVLGIILAGVTELILGAYFGTIISAWLIMAWIWYFLNRFLNLKPASENNSLLAFIPFILLSFSLFVIGESVWWLISRFVYEPELTLATLINIFSSPTICAVILVELATTFLLFRFFYHPKDFIYV